MDGIHETYEKLRNRPFARLVDAIHRVRDTARFGINTVVNESTVGELDEIADFALKIGSEELLLLPERKTKSAKGIDSRNMSALIKWISSYRGGLRLAASDHSEFGQLTNHPHGKQSDLTEYAHIDACGNLKRSSFDDFGIPIGTGGILCALATLNSDRGFSP